MLTLYRSERTDRLVDAVAEMLSVPAGASGGGEVDPFAGEMICVPARGVERWLNQMLAMRLGAADGDGIAADIEFPSPARLVDRAYAGVRGVPVDDDPWDRQRVIWRLVDVMEQVLDDPRCAPLARHLGREGRGPGGRLDQADRRYATAVHIAGLFSTYAAQRPDMLADWTAGVDHDGRTRDRVHQVSLGDHHRWQPVVWRALRQAIGQPAPAEMLDEVCARIRSGGVDLDIPSRFAVFGPTRLSTRDLAVIEALSVHRDVHLLVQFPSEPLWRSLREQRDRPAMRLRDNTIRRPAHPLLASLARDVCELALRLPTATRHSDDPVTHPECREIHLAADFAGPSLLQTLQRSIVADRLTDAGCGHDTDGAEGERGGDPTPATADGSFEVHVCHGPARQVEVLREWLLHRFDDDPGLSPRDVIVMCPDVETFAPLIRASFGTPASEGDDHPGHRLRVRLADRSALHSNEILTAMVQLCDLAASRVTATQMLTIVSAPGVRRRFGFTDDDISTIVEWTERTYIRWGLDEHDREGYRLAGFPQNTVAAGLDRVLLGVAADESAEEWLGRVLPLDGLESTDIDLAGRFAEFAVRLHAAVISLRGPHTAETWAANTVAAVDALIDPPADATWHYAQAVGLIGDTVADAGVGELAHNEFRALLADSTAARPTRSNFRTGELTVSSLVPMRSVPHRVVALLGMDDDVFPRAGRLDGDDVTGVAPLIGERDPRAEDRQLLLDALMSAREAFAIFYTGTDPVSGVRRPPSVPIGEVIDVAEAMVTGHRQSAGGPPTSLVTRHSLHSFDPVNFRDTATASYDTAARRGAQAILDGPSPRAEFVAHPLDPRDDDIALDDLVALIEHPVRAFISRRVGAPVPEVDEGLDDEIPASLDGLARWQVGERLLTRARAGVDPDRLRGSELRRGSLPPFTLGVQTLEEIMGEVGQVFSAGSAIGAEPERVVDIDVELPDGRRLTGTVAGVRGAQLGVITYSRTAPRHRLATWVRLLAMAVARPAESAGLSATIIGRPLKNRYRPTVTELTLPESPAAVLQVLLDLHDRGMRSPLPMATATGEVYAAARAAGRDHEAARDGAAVEFASFAGESTDRYLRMAFPGGFAELSTIGRADRGFTGADWRFLDAAGFPDAGDGLFADVARAIWTPVLANETRRQ